MNKLLLICSVALIGSGCATSHVKKSAFSGMLDRGQGRSSAQRETYPAIEDSEVGSEELNTLKPMTSNWRWPLKNVQITSRFGSRDGSPHEGVDLKASTGTPVYAISGGKVLYSGSKLASYGKLVVIKHQQGLSSVYAHNSNLLVKAGQKIKQGEQIALSGNTGRTSGPHVHFEIRRGVRAIDPILLIDRQQVAIPLDSGRRIIGMKTRSGPNRKVAYNQTQKKYKNSQKGSHRIQKIKFVKKKSNEVDT